MFHVEHFFSNSTEYGRPFVRQRRLKPRNSVPPLPISKTNVILNAVEEPALSERSEPNGTPTMPGANKPPQGISTTTLFLTKATRP